MKNYYEILGVSKESDNNQIKKAYRLLAKKYHPDKNKDDSNAVIKFQEISEAYNVLGNEKSREDYNKKLESYNNNQQKSTSNTFNSRRAQSKNTKKNININENKFNDLNSYFENFFGFNGKNNDINKEKLGKKKNPIDTSDMFESFFGKK